MNATLTERLENLSPAKRLLLELKLKTKTESFQSPFSIPARACPEVAPLSYNQESLLFLEQLNPGTSTYNLYEAIRIKGKLNFEALQRTFDLIVQRHESLRVNFKNTNGDWQQTIAAAEPVRIRTADLTHLGGDDNAIIAQLNVEANIPLNPEKDSLLKVDLFTLAPDENILLVTMHHIISDGWSVGLFWKEFAICYRSFSIGRTPELPELPTSFGDYTAWSREQLERDLDRQTEFWKNQLKNAPALLELPADRSRPAVQSYRGAEEVVTLPRNLMELLKATSQRENVTLFMTLLATFKVLLTRYTSVEDLVVGSPIAGRTITETENLIGFFVNTIALRTDVSGNPTFRELLARIKSTTLDAFSHQEIPFDRVVAATQPERSLSYNPIYQVAFALQPHSDSSLQIPGLEVKPVKLGSTTAKFDLFLSAKEVGDGLSVTVEYNTDLFESTTIQRIIGHYRNLLEAVTAHPDLRVSELPLLDKSEREQLINGWNQTTARIPQESLPALFEKQAALTPENVAVTAGDVDLTYHRLNISANKIARRLRKLGIRPNSAVGIFMERSALMTTGILGILKSGGAYLPLDLSYPGERLKYMLDDADIKVVLTTSEHIQNLPETSAKVLCLDLESEEFARESEENPEHVNQPGDLAYIIYTSGSTGTPKGTLIPHRAVSRLVLNTNYVRIEQSDRIAHLSNVSFDAATFELWGSLLNGARMVVFDKDVVLSPKQFAAELQRQQISIMFVTTALFNLLARENPASFKYLKTLMFGGEACDVDSVRTVIEHGRPERLLNVYGPTETTTFATWYQIGEIPPEASTIPIGRPISNTTVQILDKFLNPVPVGVSGEIFIGGVGLANGYLNRPELTAEKFIFSENVRLYRTGDQARYLPDGNIEFVGRVDQQIKLRGFRIEPGEIEAALNSYPGVKDGIVTVKESNGERKLVAYYAVSEIAPSSGEIRDFLKKRLPEFMIPSAFVEIAEMSLNPNGKIDRKKLPAFEELSPARELSSVMPKDELELKLAQIWQNVLGVRSIGLQDNFFESGGHSLTAVRLFSAIEKTLGCQLPLATLFRAPTIEQLAELIREKGWKSTWGALVPVRPDGSKAPFFCVHAVGGNILEYNDLAKYLSPDQPFYGLQALGLDGKTEPLTQIEDMAAAYLKEVRQIQPTGPYLLGGRSFGGTVAYEMARQLAEQGEETSLLAIFDSYPKGWLKLCSAEEAQELKKQFLNLRIKRHLETWRKLGMAEKLRYFLVKASFKTRKHQNLLWQWTQKLGFGKKSSVDNTIRNIEEINYLAIKNYIPKVYAGKLTFYCAADEVCPEENIMGWQRLAQGGVEVLEVPGDHQSMIKDPFVKELANALEESIGRSTPDLNASDKTFKSQMELP